MRNGNGFYVECGAADEKSFGIHDSNAPNYDFDVRLFERDGLTNSNIRYGYKTACPIIFSIRVRTHHDCQ